MPKVDTYPPPLRERERAPKAPRKARSAPPYIWRGALQQGPTRARSVNTADGRTKTRNDGDSFFTPFQSRSSIDSSFSLFLKKVITVGSFQMHQINCVPLKYSKTNYNAASVDSKPQRISSFKIFITKIQKSPWPHKIYLKKKKSVHTQLITMS